jgi:hypothetical protein
MISHCGQGVCDFPTGTCVCPCDGCDTQPKPSEQEILATTLPGGPWDGWYCKNHPAGEAIANAPDRVSCWGCGAAMRGGARPEPS